MRQCPFSRFFFGLLLCSAGVFGSGAISSCAMLFKPYEKRAQALLLPTAGHSIDGIITFVEYADGMQVSYSIQGLSANHTYGFQIHEYGNCSAQDARSAGEVFALARWKGKSEINTDLESHPEGKMPDIRSDANGVATGFVVVSNLTLDGIRSVVNRSIVILRTNHTLSLGFNRDFAAVQRADLRLACGVIRRL